MRDRRSWIAPGAVAYSGEYRVGSTRARRRPIFGVGRDQDHAVGEVLGKIGQGDRGSPPSENGHHPGEAPGTCDANDTANNPPRTGAPALTLGLERRHDRERAGHDVRLAGRGDRRGSRTPSGASGAIATSTVDTEPARVIAPTVTPGPNSIVAPSGSAGIERHRSARASQPGVDATGAASTRASSICTSTSGCAPPLPPHAPIANTSTKRARIAHLTRAPLAHARHDVARRRDHACRTDSLAIRILISPRSSAAGPVPSGCPLAVLDSPRAVQSAIVGARTISLCTAQGLCEHDEGAPRGRPPPPTFASFDSGLASLALRSG